MQRPAVFAAWDPGQPTQSPEIQHTFHPSVQHAPRISDERTAGPQPRNNDGVSGELRELRAKRFPIQPSIGGLAKAASSGVLLRHAKHERASHQPALLDNLYDPFRYAEEFRLQERSSSSLLQTPERLLGRCQRDGRANETAPNERDMRSIIWWYLWAGSTHFRTTGTLHSRRQEVGLSNEFRTQTYAPKNAVIDVLKCRYRCAEVLSPPRIHAAKLRSCCQVGHL